MRRRLSLNVLHVCVALLLGVPSSLTLSTAFVGVVHAASIEDLPDPIASDFDPWDWPDPEDDFPVPDFPIPPPDDPWDDAFDDFPAPPAMPEDELGFEESSANTAAPFRFSDERQSTYRFYNLGGTLEAGEPTLSGKMHATGWAHIKWPSAHRVVIQTFGSDIDTVLAAYTGSGFANRHLVAANDDRALAGISQKQSLIQFQVAKDTLYNIQFGGRTSATGDILLNVSALPPAGGLSAFLVQVNGVRAPVGDYVCYQAPLSSPCARARFVLYNSTDKPMTVTPSSDLGPGVVAPLPVTLGAGAAASVEFNFNSQFDQTTVRTVAGHFRFTGRDGAAVVSTARHRALILVKPAVSPPDVLQVRIKPRVRAARLNEPVAYLVYVGNAGAQDAVGCSFHTLTNQSQPVKVVWQEVNPANGHLVGSPNLPRTIHAHKSRTFRVLAVAQHAQLADPTFAGSNQPFVIECANTQPAAITLRTAFDLTARALYRPMRLTMGAVSPNTSVIDVPAAGARVRMTVKSAGLPGTVVALPSYVGPFDDPANTRFTVQICQTQTATSTCLHPLDYSVEFPMPANATRYVMVSIKRPAVDPGYDPDNRRVFVRFNEVAPAGFAYSATVAARSVAVRRK